jgi:glutathione S-transferase
MTPVTTPASFAVYISRFCGYCARVLQAIAALGAPVEVRDVTSQPELRRDIIEATGRRTVPVLRIVHADGREQWMFESRDIVRYLHERFGQAA